MDSFKPTILFLVRFGVLYALGSIFYSLYISHYDPMADPLTIFVSENLRVFMSILGQPISLELDAEMPFVLVAYKDLPSVSVFEGCNGVAVMILFIAFVLAFRGRNNKAALWFIPLGLLSIHLFNLIRLALLIVVNHYQSNLFHFYHKFLFTGVIYLFVLLFWVGWVRLQKAPDSEILNPSEQ
jgi:exosortase family protein XrtF